MRFKKIIIASLITIFWVGFAISQDTLKIEANVSAESVSLKWIPLSSNVFLTGIENGYQIERAELVGETASNPEILAEKIIPRDIAWFGQNNDAVDGLMEPVGALLYDSTFQFPPTKELNSEEMRFNFVMSEVERYDEIAAAVGLYFIDSTAISGTNYRYTIQSDDATAIGFIDVKAGEAAFDVNPFVFTEYEFPGNRSLSQMANPNPPKLPAVLGVSKAYGDSIVLRWGPNTPKFWTESNRLGYVIERKTSFDGEMEQVAFIKPWPKDTLEGLIEHDSIAMVAAAQLYDKSGAEMANGIDDLSDLFENRWGLALFAAEKSSLAADLLGFRYVDRDVEEGKMYSYEVKSLAAPGIFSIGYFDVFNEYEQSPAPTGLKIKPNDKVISLIWSKNNENSFSAYKLERSEDGGQTWKNLSESLLVFLDEERVPLKMFSYNDSVGVNYKEFKYRLSGLNSFAEMSAFAEITAQAVDLTAPPAPHIASSKYAEDLSKAVITWKEKVHPEDFAGYDIWLGDGPEATLFDTIATNLPAGTTEFTYEPEGGLADQSHYFWLVAKDKNGNINISIAHYMHIPDLIAPPPPANFTGKIDDEGKVKLYWEHSEAKDVIGYWVYFANNPNDEFRQLNTEILIVNTYAYEIPAHSLNKTAYYMVLAEDNSNNRGHDSEVLELKRPDKVPPLPPIFTNPDHENGRIMISWQPSPSEDVVKYHLFKRKYGVDASWDSLTTTVGIDATLYGDQDIEMDVRYEYQIQAEDDSGNLSDMTPSYTGILPFEPEKIEVQTFEVVSNTEEQSAKLSWDLTLSKKALPEGVSYKYRILKSIGAKNVDLLQELPADAKEFHDTEKLIPNVMYKYALQLEFSDGSIGKRSPIKSVMLQQ